MQKIRPIPQKPGVMCDGCSVLNAERKEGSKEVGQETENEVLS